MIRDTLNPLSRHAVARRIYPRTRVVAALCRKLYSALCCKLYYKLHWAICFAICWLSLSHCCVLAQDNAVVRDIDIGIPAYTKSPDIIWIESFIEQKVPNSDPQLAAAICEFRFDRSSQDSNAQAQWMMLWMHAISSDRTLKVDWSDAEDDLQNCIEDLERLSGKLAQSSRFPWVQWKKNWCRNLLNQHALAASQAVPGRRALHEWLLQSIRIGLDQCESLEAAVSKLKPDKPNSASQGKITSTEILDLLGEIELLRADLLYQRCEAYPPKSDDRIAAATEMLAAIDQAAARLPSTWAHLPLLEMARAEAELQLDRTQSVELTLAKLWNSLEGRSSPEATQWRMRLASLGARAARNSEKLDMAEAWLKRVGNWESSPELAVEFFAIQLQRSSTETQNNVANPEAVLKFKQMIAQRFGKYWEQRMDAILVSEPRWKSQLGDVVSKTDPSGGKTNDLTGRANSMNPANAKAAIELFRIEARQAIAAKNIALAIEKLQQAESAASKINATSDAFGLAMQIAALLEQSGEKIPAADEFYRVAISYPEEPKASAAALMSAWLLKDPDPSLDAEERELQQATMQQRLRDTALQWPKTSAARSAISMLEPQWISKGDLAMWMDFWRDLVRNHPSTDHIGLAAKRWLWFSLVTQEDWLEKPIGDAAKVSRAGDELQQAILETAGDNRKSWEAWFASLRSNRRWSPRNTASSHSAIEELLVASKFEQGDDPIGSCALAWNQCETDWQALAPASGIQPSSILPELVKLRAALGESVSKGPVIARLDRCIDLYTLCSIPAKLRDGLRDARSKATKSLWWVYRSAKTLAATPEATEEAVGLYRQMATGVPAGSEPWLEARARTVEILRKQGKEEQANQLRDLVFATATKLGDSEEWRERFNRQ